MNRFACGCGSGKEKERPGTKASITPVVTNWVNKAMNEEYFKIQTDLEKMRIYQKELITSLTRPSALNILNIKAEHFVKRIKEYIFDHVFSRYVVYIEKMQRENLGDKGVLTAKISDSVTQYVYNNIVIKVYKSGMFDLNIDEMAVEIDPIREVELQLGDDHPLSIEYKRDHASANAPKIKQLGLVYESINGEADPQSVLNNFQSRVMKREYAGDGVKETQHPFYKEYDARTMFRPDKIYTDKDFSSSSRGGGGREEDKKNMSVLTAEALYKRGDIFEPTRLTIPREYWAHIDPGLLNHMVSYGYINMYSKC